MKLVSSILLVLLLIVLTGAVHNANAAYVSPTAAREKLTSLGYSFLPIKIVVESRNGNPEVVELFLLAGVSPDTVDKQGWTSLMYAADINNEKIAKMMIDKKARLNLQNSGGSTALMIAASKGNTAVARLLLEAGASVLIRDKSGNTALMLASGAGHAEAVQALINAGADINEKNSAGQTAFDLADKNNRDDVKKILKPDVKKKK